MAMSDRLAVAFVEIKADQSGFNRSLNQVEARTQRTTQRLSQRFERLNRSMQDLFKPLAIGAAGAAVAMGGLAKVAADFETSMVEVQKVTDPKTMKALTGEIRQMAKTIPLAHEELAAMTADAARFGVRGVENIRAFTEATAKMATATDLSSQKAGEAFARLATLTDTPVDKIENLGSSINELSNNLATSSSEIVDSMLRSSAALGSLGLNQTEMAGLSAALNEVSESAERAGTRLRRLSQELMDPGNVKDLADALGMTVEQFKAMRQESPVDLIQRMAQAIGQGGEAANKLRAALSVVSQQALGALSQNMEGLASALQISAKQFRENTSLQREFEAAIDTTNAKIQLFQNDLRNLAITLGNALLPHVNSLIERLRELVQNLTGTAQRIIQNWDEVAARIGRVRDAFLDVIGVFVGGREAARNLIGTIGNVAGKFLIFVGAVQAASLAFSLLSRVFAVFAATARVVTGILTVLISRFTIIPAIIGGAMLVAVTAWRENWFGMRDVLEKVWGVIKPIIDAIGSAVSNLPSAKQVLLTVKEKVSDAAQWIIDHAGKAFEIAVEIGGQLAAKAQDLVAFIRDASGKVWEITLDIAASLGDVARWVVKNAGQAIQITAEIVSQVPEAVRSIIGTIREAAQGAKQVSVQVAASVGRSVQWIIDHAGQAINLTVDIVGDIAEGVRSVLDFLAQSAQGTRSLALDVGGRIGQAVQWVMDHAGQVVEVIVDVVGNVSEAVQSIVGFVSGAASGAYNIALNVSGDIAQAVQWLMDAVGTAIDITVNVVGEVSDALKTAFQFLSDQAGTAKTITLKVAQAVSDAARWIIENAGKAVEVAVEFVGTVSEGIGDVLGFLRGAAQTAHQITLDVVTAIGDIAGWVVEHAGQAIKITVNVVGTIADALKAAIGFLADAAQTAYEIGVQVTGTVADVVQWVIDHAGDVIEVAVNIAGSIAQGIQATLDFIRQAAGTAKTITLEVIGAVSDAVQWVSANAGKAFEVTVNVVGTVADAVRSAIGFLVDAAQTSYEISVTVAGHIGDALQWVIDHAGDAVEITLSVVSKVAGAAEDTINFLKDQGGKAMEIGGQVALTVSNAAQKTWEIIKSLWSDIKSGIQITFEGAREFVEAFQGFSLPDLNDQISALKKGVSSLGKALGEAANRGLLFSSDVLDSLSSGLKSARSRIVEIRKELERLNKEGWGPDSGAQKQAEKTQEQVKKSVQRTPIQLSDELKTFLKSFREFGRQLALTIVESFKLAWEGGKLLAKAVADITVNLAKKGADIAADIWEGLKDFFKGSTKTLRAEFSEVLGAVVEGVEVTVSKIKLKIEKINPKDVAFAGALAGGGAALASIVAQRFKGKFSGVSLAQGGAIILSLDVILDLVVDRVGQVSGALIEGGAFAAIILQKLAKRAGNKITWAGTALRVSAAITLAISFKKFTTDESGKSFIQQIVDALPLAAGLSAVALGAGTGTAIAITVGTKLLLNIIDISLKGLDQLRANIRDKFSGEFSKGLAAQVEQGNVQQALNKAVENVKFAFEEGDPELGRKIAQSFVKELRRANYSDAAKRFISELQDQGIKLEGAQAKPDSLTKFTSDAAEMARQRSQQAAGGRPPLAGHQTLERATQEAAENAKDVARNLERVSEAQQRQADRQPQGQQLGRATQQALSILDLTAQQFRSFNQGLKSLIERFGQMVRSSAGAGDVKTQETMTRLLDQLSSLTAQAETAQQLTAIRSVLERIAEARNMQFGFMREIQSLVEQGRSGNVKGAVEGLQNLNENKVVPAIENLKRAIQASRKQGKTETVEHLQRTIQVLQAMRQLIAQMAQTRGFQKGGSVPGSGRGDKIPAMLEPGEFVLTRAFVQRNPQLMSQIRAAMDSGKTLPGFQSGGYVRMQEGGKVPAKVPTLEEAIADIRETLGLSIEQLKKLLPEGAFESVGNLRQSIEELFGPLDKLEEQVKQGTEKQNEMVKQLQKQLNASQDGEKGKDPAQAAKDATEKMKEAMESASGTMSEEQKTVADLMRDRIDSIFSKFRPQQAMATAKRLQSLMQKSLPLVMQGNVEVASELTRAQDRLVTGIKQTIDVFEQLGLSTKGLESQLEKVSALFGRSAGVLASFRSDMKDLAKESPVEAIRRIRKMAGRIAQGGPEALAQMAQQGVESAQTSVQTTQASVSAQNLNILPSGAQFALENAQSATVQTDSLSFPGLPVGAQFALQNADFAEGGHTGPGAKSKPAGVVHAGEYVIPANMVRDMPGLVGMLERMRQGKSVQGMQAALDGFQGGGPVGLRQQIQDLREAQSAKQAGASMEQAAQMPLPKSLIQRLIDMLKQLAKSLGKNADVVQTLKRQIGQLADQQITLPKQSEDAETPEAGAIRSLVDKLRQAGEEAGGVVTGQAQKIATSFSNAASKITSASEQQSESAQKASESQEKTSEAADQAAQSLKDLPQKVQDLLSGANEQSQQTAAAATGQTGGGEPSGPASLEAAIQAAQSQTGAMPQPAGGPSFDTADVNTQLNNLADLQSQIVQQAQRELQMRKQLGLSLGQLPGQIAQMQAMLDGLGPKAQRIKSQLAQWNLKPGIAAFQKLRSLVPAAEGSAKAMSLLADKARSLTQKQSRLADSFGALGLASKAKAARTQLNLLKIRMSEMSGPAKRVATELERMDLSPTVAAMRQIKALVPQASGSAEALGLLSDKANELIRKQSEMVSTFESLGMADAAKDAKKKLKDMKKALGQSIKERNKATDEVTSSTDQVSNSMDRASDQTSRFQEALADVTNTLLSEFKSFGGRILGPLGAAFGGLVDAITSGNLAALIKGVTESFFALLQQSNTFKSLMSEVQPILQAFSDFVGQLLSPLVDLAKQLREFLGISKDTTESLSSMQTNVPQGFKFNRLRFAAAKPDQPADDSSEDGGTSEAVFAKFRELLGKVGTALNWLWNQIVRFGTNIVGFLKKIGLWSVIQAAINAIQSFVSRIFGVNVSVLDLIKGLGLLTTAFMFLKGLIKQIPIIGPILNSILNSFGSALTAFVGSVLKPLWMGFVNAILKPIWMTLVNALKAAWMGLVNGILQPLWLGLINSLKSLWTTLLTGVIKPLWTTILNGIGSLWTSFVNGVLAPLWKLLVNQVGTLWSTFVKSILTPLWNQFIGAILKPLWQTFLTGILKPLFGSFVNAVLKPLFGGLVNTVLKPLWTALIAKLGPMWKGLILGVKKLFGVLVNSFLFPIFKSFLMGVAGWMQSVIGTVVGLVKVGLTAPLNGLVAILGTVTAGFMLFPPLFAKFKQKLVALGPPLTKLWNALKSLVTMVAAQLKPAWMALRGVIKTVTQVFVAKFQPILLNLIGIVTKVVNILKTILVGAIQFVTKALNKLRPTIGKLTAAILTFWQKITGAINPVLTQLHLLIKQVLGVIQSQGIPIIRGFINIVTQTINIMKSVLVPIIRGVAKILKRLRGDVVQLIKAILDLWGSVTTQLGPAFKQLKLTLGSLVQTFMSSVIPVLRSLINIIKLTVNTAKSILIPIIKAITQIFKQVRPPLNQLIKTTMKVVNNILSALLPAFRQFKQIIVGVVTTVANKLAPILSKLIQIVTKVVQAIGNLLTPIIKSITTLFKKLKTPIQNVTSQIMSFINTLISRAKPVFNALKRFATAVGNVIGTVIKVVAPTFKNIIKVLGGVISFIKSLLKPAFKVLGAIINALTAAFKALQPAIKILGKAVGFLSSLVKTVVTPTLKLVGSVLKPALNGLASIINNVIVPAFKALDSALNAIESVFSAVVNGIKSVINGVISAINVIPFVSIPKLAEGGIVKQGGLAEIHKGETIVPAQAQPIPMAQSDPRPETTGGKGDLIINGMKIEDPDLQRHLERVLRQKNLRQGGSPQGTAAIE